jgi:cytochrome c biogenesis protein CcmG/thiol:disulfide interchange protein DsbE
MKMKADTMSLPDASTASGRKRGRLRYFAPLTVFVMLAIVFGWGLTRNPRILPSTLIGKSVPQFVLPPVQGRTLGLSSADLQGEVSIVNVFASWCTECKYEHALLMQLQASKEVPLHGINYKDRPDDAQKWLDSYGDPYTRTGADLNGRVGIEWGVYGVPETFVIGKDGRIAFKQIGRLTPEILEKKVLPLVRSLRAQSSSRIEPSNAALIAMVRQPEK